MPDRHYPRFGCSFCITHRDKLEQIMKHLDDHLSELMDAKMKPRRPAGDHALELIRAVRRGSERKGLNALIKLKPSRFDGCRNWRLYDVIADEDEYLRFMQRRCRAQKEWLALATMFLESAEAERFAADDKASKHSYKPDWSMLDEDGEDDEDDDGDEDDTEEIAWKTFLAAAKAKRASGELKSAGPRAGMNGSIVDARVTMSPVKPKGGKYSISGLAHETRIRSRKAELGNARMEMHVGKLANRENDRGAAVKKESEKKSSSNTNNGNKNGKGREKRPHADTIDLTTPVKDPRIQSPDDDDDDDDDGFDIETPKHDKTITLFVKCFDDNGLYEIDVSCALEAAIRMVEERMNGIRIKCFRTSEGKRVTARMWEKMVSKVIVVTADWEFDEEEDEE